MLFDADKNKALQEEIDKLTDKILDFLTNECKENGHSAGACYIAMRMFLYHWINMMGPEMVKEVESQFQIIPGRATIPSC